MKNMLMFSLFTAAMLAAGTAAAGGGNLLGGAGGGIEEGTMYGGGSVGQSTTNCMLQDAFAGDPVLGGEKDCSTNGWKVYGGYQVTDMFAIEGGYYSLGTSEESAVGTTTKSLNGNSYTFQDPKMEGNASGVGISGVATIPVMDSLNVFGKVGAMKWKSEGTMSSTISNGAATYTTTVPADVEGTSLLLGAGASYSINENWGIRGEYEHFKRQDVLGEDRDVGIMSAGVTFSTL